MTPMAVEASTGSPGKAFPFLEPTLLIAGAAV